MSKRLIRRDKEIPVQRLSDKILLFLLSNMYLAYLIYFQNFLYLG